MTPDEFRDELTRQAERLELLARGGERMGDDFIAGLNAALARRCRELADEAAITRADSFDRLEDRLAALGGRPDPPARAGFRFVPRPARRLDEDGKDEHGNLILVPPGADVFDPDAAEGWPPFPTAGIDDVRYSLAR
jgi:hypothetical protein